MTIHSSHSVQTAGKLASAIALLSVLGGLPAAVSAQYMNQMQNRPEPREKMMMPFERSVNLGDLWYIQSSEKAEGDGRADIALGLQDRLVVPGHRALHRPRDARRE